HKQTPGLNHYLIDTVHDMARGLGRKIRLVSIELRWLQRHKRDTGDEEVDNYTKPAPEPPSQSLAEPSPISKSAANKIHSASLQQKIADSLLYPHRHERLLKINPFSPSVRFKKLINGVNRHQQSILVLRSVYDVPLNKHLDQIKKSDSQLCPSCFAADETIFHFIMSSATTRRSERKCAPISHEHCVPFPTLVGQQRRT
ncbi:hypothetical protein BU17DRAFT_57474, partial [Hysterangium stoloniferum]